MPTDKTRVKIEKAIASIQQGTAKYVARNARLNISSVAEEAGISRQTLYESYPQLVKKIQQRTGKTHQSKLKQYELKLAHYQKRITLLQAENKKIKLERDLALEHMYHNDIISDYKNKI